MTTRSVFGTGGSVLGEGCGAFGGANGRNMQNIFGVLVFVTDPAYIDIMIDIILFHSLDVLCC